MFSTKEIKLKNNLAIYAEQTGEIKALLAIIIVSNDLLVAPRDECYFYVKNAIFSNLRILGNNHKRCQCPGYFLSEILGGERGKCKTSGFHIIINCSSMLSINCSTMPPMTF